jgi:hypothetical protein
MRGRHLIVLLLLVVTAALSGCHTDSPPPLDFAGAGWKVRRGQAVWRPGPGVAEITGELLVGTHPDGRALVQFTRTQTLLVSAQTSSMRWQVRILPDDSLEGFGPPPSRVVWLHVAKFIGGAAPPSRWTWERGADNTWRLENRATGEILLGQLAP